VSVMNTSSNGPGRSTHHKHHRCEIKRCCTTHARAIYIEAESEASPVTDLVLKKFVLEEEIRPTLVHQKSIGECHKVPSDREAFDFAPQIGELN